MTSPPKSDLEGTPSIINKRANRLPCYWITPGEYETLQVLYHKSSNFQVFTYINYCTWFLSRVFFLKKIDDWQNPFNNDKMKEPNNITIKYLVIFV